MGKPDSEAGAEGVPLGLALFEGAPTEGVAKPVAAAVPEGARELVTSAVWEAKALPRAEALALPHAVAPPLPAALDDPLGVPVPSPPLPVGRCEAAAAPDTEGAPLKDGAAVGEARAEGVGGTVEKGVPVAGAEREPLPLLLLLACGESDAAALLEEESDARLDGDMAALPEGESDARVEALSATLRLSQDESEGLPDAEWEPRGEGVLSGEREGGALSEGAPAEPDGAPLSLASREAAPLPDPAAVAESRADCKAEAEPDVEGLGEGLPVAEASAAVGVAAGLCEAHEGDPVTEGAGDAEGGGDAVSVGDGEAPEVANALSERGVEAEGGALPLLASVPGAVCDGVLDGAKEGVAGAEAEATTPVIVGTSDMMALIVRGNSLAVGLGVTVAVAATEPSALRVCAAEPLLAALTEGTLLALPQALGEAQAVGTALAVVHALPKGDGDALPLPVCATDPTALLVPQPVLLPLTDAGLPVLLEHEEREGAWEDEDEPEGLREAAIEGLLLSQCEALGGPLSVPRGLGATLPVSLLVNGAVGESLPLGAPPLPEGKALLLNVPLALPGPRLWLFVNTAVALTLLNGVREARMLAEPLNVPLAEPLLLAPFDASALPLPPPLEALVAGVALRVGAPPLAVPGAPPLRDVVGDRRALAVAEGGTEARLEAVGEGLAEGLGEGALLQEGEPEALRSSEGVGDCEVTGQLLAVALGEPLMEVVPLRWGLALGVSVDVALAVMQGEMVPLPLCDGATLSEEEWEALPDELAPMEAVKVELGEPVAGTVSEPSGEPLRGAEGEGQPDADTEGLPDAVVAMVSLRQADALPPRGVALPEALDEMLLLPAAEPLARPLALTLGEELGVPEVHGEAVPLPVRLTDAPALLERAPLGEAVAATAVALTQVLG